MKLFGLIGYPLSHSFSKRYFTEKFEKLGIADCQYELFPIPSIEELPSLIAAHPNLIGLNVTIPYKQAVLPYLDAIDTVTAARIGAVNTIKIEKDGTLKGYNSDYFGFKNSLENWLAQYGQHPASMQALVLGNGGAAKAIFTALTDLGCSYEVVSRQASDTSISYDDLTAEKIASCSLIINTTPLGMSPHLDTAPSLPYNALTENHFLYDLVYNPEVTLFMQKGLDQGAKTMNGLEMLHLQAEKSWEIWNS